MRSMFRYLTFLVLPLCVAAAAMNAQRVGGYKQISKTDAGARSAAEFAVDAQAERKGISIELISLEKAESQVVAGTNYRLCMKISSPGGEDDDAVTSEVRVIVYRNLKGEYSLTSWIEENCAPEDDG